MTKKRYRWEFCSCTHENMTYYYFVLYRGSKKIHTSGNYRSRGEMLDVVGSLLGTELAGGKQ